MDTKTQVFLFDNVISNDLCDSIRILIDKSDGTITEYAKGETVRCKVANIENPKLRKLIDDELYNVVSSIIAKIRKLALCGYQEIPDIALEKFMEQRDYILMGFYHKVIT